MNQVENARPSKRSVWLWVRILFLFALFVVIAVLPALSVIPVAAVPPLADMQVSEGTISFRPVDGRSGALMVVRKDDGHKDEFSCRENMQGVHRWPFSHSSRACF